MSAAITLAVQVSGKAQKAVALDLEIDQGQWSRIMSGQAHFPHDKLDLLCDVLANEIPLQWWAERRGYELHRKVTALEAELVRLHAELRDAGIRERALMEAIGRR